MRGTPARVADPVRPPVRGRRSARPALVLAAAALLAAGCDSGSSPTEPPPPGPAGLSIVIVDPSGAFTAHHATVRRLLEETHAAASASLPVGAVTVTVTADAARSIPGWGLGGYAPGPYTVEIVLDTGFAALGEILGTRLPQVAAHEFHHAVRWRGPGYGATLHETMISEGLADHYAIQVTGNPPPPWCTAFPESETEHFLDVARPELDSGTFDFGVWFFTGRPGLPPWTGYTLGFQLVGAYLAAHPGESAASLVDAPASLFPR